MKKTQTDFKSWEGGFKEGRRKTIEEVEKIIKADIKKYSLKSNDGFYFINGNEVLKQIQELKEKQ